MKKFDRATKYTVIVCIILVAFNMVFAYVLITQAAKATRTQINERMLDISNTAAAMLDGDALKKITKDDYGSPEYTQVMKTLTYFQENIDLDYIYCVMQVSEREFVFGVDPTIEDPGEFGSPIVYTDALYNASKGEAGVDDVAYEDDWGSFYSAYSPVFDSDGNVAGIVAVDFDSEWYQKKVQGLLGIVGSFIMFALVCSVALAIAIARQYRKIFLNLMDRMSELSQGIDTLIHEVDLGNNSENYTELVYVDRSSMKDAVDMLGEKIRLMQVRLKEQIKVIRSHAYIDGLTGLHNRTAYTEFLNLLEKRIAENSNYVFSVVVFDINQLKMINDDYGHDMGDKLIIAIARDIRNVFGEQRVYRIGGDEFVAILDEPDPSERITALRISAAQSRAKAPIIAGQNIETGLSIGFATYDAATDRTYSDVFHRADNAMYADKRAFYETHADRRRRR
ncbi:MAG: diguanylate cyclase [Lachnospiraceae bacterium]|nr:diguanylate cyclase [Lachnospiraceae bacterium]